MNATSKTTYVTEACEYTGQPQRVVELARLCDRITAAATTMKAQALAGDIDLSLIPADVLNRLEEHTFDNPSLTCAAIVSRACTFYFRNVLNCEAVPPDMARIILAGRPVEPAPAGKAVPR